MARRIGMTDIAYYAKRVTVYEKEVDSINCVGQKVKRECTSHYRIDGQNAIKFKNYWIGQEKKELILEEVFISDIYDRIKNVYDFNNVLIARRIARKSPLTITAKGMSKFLKYG